MRTTPTKKELNEVIKLQRQAKALEKKAESLCYKLKDKYAPCKIGDIIEGGKTKREKGVVTFIRFGIPGAAAPWWRITYRPMRGKKVLKTPRSFYYLDTIKVITPAK